MSNTRTLSVLAAALAVGAAAFGKLLNEADANARPVNLHDANGVLATFATDASEFAQVVADSPAGADQALTDRVTHLETLLTEAGLDVKPAPAPAPAQPVSNVVPIQGANDPAL
jgi:hypothetical protein